MFFYLGFSFILIHEMDAIRCHEWRLFPGLASLNDKSGFMVFTLAHIPLFYFLLVGLLGQQDNTGLIFGLNVFFIAHFAMHLLFLMHKKNEFKDWLSWTLIAGAAFFGLLDILLP
jgi:Family of unknown function (DUF6713)